MPIKYGLKLFPREKRNKILLQTGEMPIQVQKYHLLFNYYGWNNTFKNHIENQVHRKIYFGLSSENDPKEVKSICVSIFAYTYTCMHEYMYLQTDTLRKLGKEYSQNKYLKMTREVLEEGPFSGTWSHWINGQNEFYMA